MARLDRYLIRPSDDCDIVFFPGGLFDMKRFATIITCALCFGLGTLVPLRRTHAQDSTSGHTFYVVDYMKSRPGQDPFKIERDLWKPLHQEVLKNGGITSWAAMRPVLAGPHNYDYITVTGYRSMEAYGKWESVYLPTAEKIWGKEKVQSSMAKTDEARDMLGSEMYAVVDEVNNNTK
jgi:hypothetical protein